MTRSPSPCRHVPTRSVSRLTAVCSAALAALILSGCGATRPIKFATSGQESDAPRRAPGVAFDPAPRIPPAESAANPSQGLVVLRTPANPAAARDTVRDFFRAVVDEAPDKLDELVDSQAYVQTGSGQGRQRALSYWRRRLSRLDYGALAGRLVYHPSEVETYRAVDVARLRSTRHFPVSLGNDDILIRVPIAVPRVGNTRLFGDEILFVLHPHAQGYTISEMVEDFQLT